MIPGNIEFRIRRDILADVKSKSCSNVNFLWMLTRQIYHDEELIGCNFFGRKGRKPISPRRKKCLKAAFLDSCRQVSKTLHRLSAALTTASELYEVKLKGN